MVCRTCPKGSGKATLPGPIQAFRSQRGDRITIVPSLANQVNSTYTFTWNQLPHAADEQPLIHKVWDTSERTQPFLPPNWLEKARHRRAVSTEKQAAHPAQQSTASSPKVFLDVKMLETLQAQCQESQV